MLNILKQQHNVIVQYWIRDDDIYIKALSAEA